MFSTNACQTGSKCRTQIFSLYIELPYLCPNYNIYIQSEIFMSKTAMCISKLQHLYFQIFRALFSKNIFSSRHEFFSRAFLDKSNFMITMSCKFPLKCLPSSKTTWRPTGECHTRGKKWFCCRGLDQYERTMRLLSSRVEESLSDQITCARDWRS